MIVMAITAPEAALIGAGAAAVVNLLGIAAIGFVKIANDAASCTRTLSRPRSLTESSHMRSRADGSMPDPKSAFVSQKPCEKSSATWPVPSR